MKIVVIGGGASGMAAAVSARRTNSNAQITVAEKMDRVGKKILSTGNGCCNFSNVYTSQSNFHGKNTDFVNYALNEFTVDFTVNFFNKLGIFAREKENGRLYPFSDQASAVLDALRAELAHCDINVVNNFCVKTVSKQNNKFKIISADGSTLVCDRVIIAAGGCASPALGSDGSGFDIAKKLGHKMSPVQPALVQLKTDLQPIKGLKGIKILGRASVLDGKKVIAEEKGEILFTDYGVSGPPIFQISAAVPFKKGLVLSIDFMPDYTLHDVYDMLSQRKLNLQHMTMESFFVGLLNKRAGNNIARAAGIEKLSYPVNKLDKKQIWSFADNIKGYRMEITGTNGFKNAQVTAGGLYTDMFDEKTMQSKIVKGLYCCGEIYDIYGDCGGYNLQWAWSSGFLAGREAVKEN